VNGELLHDAVDRCGQMLKPRAPLRLEHFLRNARRLLLGCPQEREGSFRYHLDVDNREFHGAQRECARDIPHVRKPASRGDFKAVGFWKGP
jgi:hypothetical protein